MGKNIRCLKCGTELKPEEVFCSNCGNKVVLTAEEKRQNAARIGMRAAKFACEKKIKSGRTIILVIAILTLIATPLFYFIQKSQVNTLDQQLAEYKSSPDYDPDIGKDAEREVAAAHAGIWLSAGLNLFLALLYFGLWAWAKYKPFPAALIALFIYVALWGIDIVIEPAYAARGILIKILIILALIGAVSSAYKYKKLREANI